MTFKKVNFRAKLYRVHAGGKNALVIAKSKKQATQYQYIAMGVHRANIITACSVEALTNEHGAYAEINITYDDGASGFYAPIAC
jgi:hypothetical protein